MALGKELLYIIRAKDSASSEITKVKRSFDAANTSAQGTSRTMGILSGLLTREVGQGLKQFGTSILDSLLGFADAGAEAVRVTKELDQVLLSTKGAAGLTAAEVQGMASALQKVTNFEDETIVRGQNMLLTFTKIGKDVFPQATEAMLNMATKMKTDVSTAALQLGKALQDPAEGLSALSRMGVRFTDEQERMIQTMVAAGDVAGAQRIILQQLETQFGGMARAVSDSRTQLSNSINDIKENIGKILLPALDSAAKAALPVIQAIGDWIMKHQDLTKTIIFVSAALASLAVVLGSLIVTIGSVGAALAALGISLAVGGALGLAIAGITALVVVLIQHWEGLKWMAGEAIDYITQKMVAFADLVSSAVQVVIDKIKAFVQMVKDAAKAAAELASSTLNTASFGAVGTPRRADGGYSGGWTTVGERGTELVNLPRGSFVHPAGETERMMRSEDRAQLTAVKLEIGQINVYREADEDRLIDKMKRMIELQSLAAA